MSLLTWDTTSSVNVFDYRAFTSYGVAFHPLLLTLTIEIHCPTTLHIRIEFRLIPFRSPLLRKSLLLSFPPVTKMFQFTGFALSSL